MPALAARPADCPAPPRPYYPALTGLRAIAAWLVFAAHFRPLDSSDLYERISERGGLGVSIFFVLSGFVIAARYQQDLRLTADWWRTYLWRRFARIYPVFFLLNGLALWQLYWPITSAHSLVLIFLSMSLLKGFSNTLMFVGLPQSWSLTAEECFYLTAPLVLLWQRRWRAAPLAFGALMMALGLALTALCSDRPELHGFFNSFRAFFYYSFFGRVFDFMAGVLLARWWVGRPAASPAARHPWRTTTGLLLMLLAAAWIVWLNPKIEWYEGAGPQVALITNTLFPVGVVLLLAGLLAEGSWLRTFLATPLMQALGRSSYFFYLFHVGVFSVWWQHRFGWGQQVGWQFLITLVVSELGYRLFEEPVRRWITARTIGER